MLDRFTMRPASLFFSSGSNAWVKRDDRKEIRIEGLPQNLCRSCARFVRATVVHENASIVHQNVEHAEVLLDRSGDSRIIRRIIDIQLHGAGIDALFFQRGRRGLALGQVASAQQNGNALLCPTAAPSPVQFPCSRR